MADREFYDIIYQVCQNKLLTMNLESLREIVDYYRIITVHYQEIRQGANEYHKRIFEAFKNRDYVYARMCMIDHLTEVKRAGDLHNAFEKEMKEVIPREII